MDQTLGWREGRGRSALQPLLGLLIELNNPARRPMISGLRAAGPLGRRTAEMATWWFRMTLPLVRSRRGRHPERTCCRDAQRGSSRNTPRARSPCAALMAQSQLCKLIILIKSLMRIARYVSRTDEALPNRPGTVPGPAIQWSASTSINPGSAFWAIAAAIWPFALQRRREDGGVDSVIGTLVRETASAL